MTEQFSASPDGEGVGPYEGKVVGKDGKHYRYELASVQLWDDIQEIYVTHRHSLRTWFAHSTEGVGPGPGWDFRIGLFNLSAEEMMERYGHVFTDEEIFSPSLMPDDIPYYELIQN